MEIYRGALLGARLQEYSQERTSSARRSGFVDSVHGNGHSMATVAEAGEESRSWRSELSGCRRRGARRAMAGEPLAMAASTATAAAVLGLRRARRARWRRGESHGRGGPSCGAAGA